MKRLYITFMRALRAVARTTGLLGALEKRAATSRRAMWWRSLFAIYDLDDMIALDVPWWTFDAIDTVEVFLAGRSAPRVFEWGAGASTVWLSRRSAEVTSIEHDPDWFARMTPVVVDNVTLRYVPAVAADTPSQPSQKPGFAGLDFSAYVAAIDETTENFDLIVIDGRAREACLARALRHIAPGGIIVFDNVGRPRYRTAIELAGPGVDVLWTRGRTVALPYPDRTAILTPRA